MSSNLPTRTGAMLDAVAESTAAEVKAAEAAHAAKPVTLTRTELLDLLTVAAQIGHEIDYAGTTRGDITAAVASRMRRRLDDLHTAPVGLVPTEISGYRVTDAVRASSLDSRVVHVIAEDERGERVVWDCVREAGQWRATNGAYGRSRSWCLGVLVERLGWPTAADHEDARLAQAGTERQYNRLRSAVYRAIDGLDSTQPDVDQVLDALRRAMDA